MLVVSRKEQESIRLELAEDLDPSLTIGEVFAEGPVSLTLTHIGARRVRIAIEAPSALKVRRIESPSTAPGDETGAEARADASRRTRVMPGG